MKSENVKERPLTKLDEYAILISKHWKRSKTGADDYDPTSILVNFKKDMKEVIKNELISDGWAKTAWHKVIDRDFPPVNKKVLFKLAQYDELTVGFLREDGLFDLETYPGFYGTDADIIAWTELPTYEE